MDKTTFITLLENFAIFAYPSIKKCPSSFSIPDITKPIFSVLLFYTYIDDVIFKSWSQYLSDHVHSVFSLIKSVWHTFKPTKCVWEAPSVEFLGMVVSANGINIPHACTQTLPYINISNLVKHSLYTNCYYRCILF